jgi:hypothetical protein
VQQKPEHELVWFRCLVFAHIRAHVQQSGQQEEREADDEEDHPHSCVD